MQIVPTPPQVAATLFSNDEWKVDPIHIDKGTESPLSVVLFEGSAKPGGQAFKYNTHEVVIILDGTSLTLLSTEGQ